MKIGLIDVDNHGRMDKCFPNLALMKISSYHKRRGDSVSFYDPMFSGHMDRVYMSKVFSFSPDYPFGIDADEIVRGGTGYCINNVNGRETWDSSMHTVLPDEIEHSFPDYSLYGIEDTAYGFMTRGCPRGCDFCIVKHKEGLCAHKVANLDEFWNGQKNIELMDANTFACREWEDVVDQLVDSRALVNFNQGVDIRIMTEAKVERILKVRTRTIHFAFDRYDQKDIVEPRLKMFREVSGYRRNKVSVYILCGFDTSLEQDLERIMFVRNLGFQPYVMLYEKYRLPRGHVLRRMQRWVNNPYVFWKTERFDDYAG